MQQMPPTPGQTPRPNDVTQTQRVIIIAIAMFAVAGLLVGFTFGRITKSAKTGQTPIVQSPRATTPTTATTPTIAATATVDVYQVRIGCPDIKSFSATQSADSTTSYTLSAQIIDKSIDSKDACGKGKPLYAPNIMCKMWLTQDAGSIETLLTTSQDTLKAATFQNPFPKEEQTAFVFDENTPQVQPCSQTGLTTWNYKLSPTLKSGTYYLAVIADWKGQRFNWYYVLVKIKGL